MNPTPETREMSSKDPGFPPNPQPPFEPVPLFHFFHRWGKWQEITTHIVGGEKEYDTVEQSRVCLVCNMRQDRSIEP
jgi:hypothetical protein